MIMREESAVRKETGGERFKRFIVDNLRGVLCYSAICALIVIGLYVVGYGARAMSRVNPTRNGLETKVITELELKQDVEGKLRNRLFSCRTGNIYTANTYCFYIESPDGRKLQKLSADRVLIKESSDDNMRIEGFFDDSGNCHQTCDIEYTIYIPEGRTLLSDK